MIRRPRSVYRAQLALAAFRRTTGRARLLTHYRRIGLHSGRWSPGPYSHLERLRRAALGDHECRYFPVRITP